FQQGRHPKLGRAAPCNDRQNSRVGGAYWADILRAVRAGDAHEQHRRRSRVGENIARRPAAGVSDPTRAVRVRIQIRAVRMSYALHTGNAVDVLRDIPAESVQSVVTSPPYWGLRNYGATGQIGLEPTLVEHIAVL